MDGEQDGAKGAAEQKAGVAQPQGQEGREQKAQQVTPPAPVPTPEDDYKALLAKRDERIAELEASVAEARAYDIFPDGDEACSACPLAGIEYLGVLRHRGRWCHPRSSRSI